MSLFETDNNSTSLEVFSNSLLLAWVGSLLNLSVKRIDLILQKYSSLDKAILDNFNRLDRDKNKWLAKFVKKSDYKNDVENFSNKLNQHKIQILSYFDSRYPENLKNLPTPPVVLYYQGNIDLLQVKEAITVVGSRNFSKYSEIILDKILAPACKLNLTVVSGLALGIDGLAHSISLKNDSSTIAVIGSGLDDASFYPQTNLALKKQILQKNGLVLSEYPAGFRATSFTFPARNRILAALTSLTWVVEAGYKSGSLITAKLANDLGKTVATSPGSILEKNLQGNLELLKNGAVIISEYQDIFDYLGLKTHPEIQIQNTRNFSNPEEEKVYQTLTLEPQNVEILAEKNGLVLAEINMHLTMLELSNLAINMGENNWIKGG